MSSVHTDSDDLGEFGYTQKLDRSLGSFSSFAAGFSYISILTGMFQTSYLGYLFAGPAFIWAWIFVFFGQFMVALQFAELSSHYPLAGSVYQWSRRVAPRGWGWNTGWMYLAAQIVTIPAVALSFQIILPQISSSFQMFDCTPAVEGDLTTNCAYLDTAFAKNAMVLGLILVAFTTFINILGVHVTAMINNVGVAAELIGATLLVVLFLVNAQRSPGAVLSETFDTGANYQWGYFGALLLGAYMGLYVMYGFDTAGSLAEETKNPRRTAPRALLRALTTAAVMGFLLILFGTMATSDAGFTYEALSSSGLAGIVVDVFGTTLGKIFLIDVIVAITVCCLAIQAAAVRIMFAMARDNNLPFSKQLSHVSGRAKVPIVPAVFTGLVSALILMFNIINARAFTIVVSCGILFMYLAYLGVTLPLLRNRLKGWPRQTTYKGEKLFSLGRFALITNVLAVLYGISMAINLAWPREAFYGTLWYQKYGVIVAMLAVVISGLIVYNVRKASAGEVLDEHRVGVGAD